MADAITRLERVAWEGRYASTVIAHDNPDVTLARLTAILDR